MKKLARIDYLDRRFSSYVSRTLNSLAKESEVLEELGRSIESQSKGKARITASTKDFLENLGSARYVGIRRMTERLVRACSGHWGYPRDVTLKRLRMVTEKVGNRVYLSDDPIWRAVPRMKPSDVRRWKNETFPPPQFKNEGVTCHCRQCRTSVSCICGRGISAGYINCRWCDFVRHVGGAIRSRDSINRRGEGNYPLRFCRACGYVTCRCQRKAPPRRK